MPTLKWWLSASVPFWASCQALEADGDFLSGSAGFTIFRTIGFALGLVSYCDNVSHRSLATTTQWPAPPKSRRVFSQLSQCRPPSTPSTPKKRVDWLFQFARFKLAIFQVLKKPRTYIMFHDQPSADALPVPSHRL